MTRSDETAPLSDGAHLGHQNPRLYRETGLLGGTDMDVVAGHSVGDTSRSSLEPEARQRLHRSGTVSEGIRQIRMSDRLDLATDEAPCCTNYMDSGGPVCWVCRCESNAAIMAAASVQAEAGFR
jgi:hypothetical protein